MWSFFIKIVWVRHVICRIISYINIFTDGSCSVTETWGNPHSPILNILFQVYYFCLLADAECTHVTCVLWTLEFSHHFGVWKLAANCLFCQVLRMIEKSVVVHRLDHSWGGVRYWLLTTEVRVISCEVCGGWSYMEQVFASDFFGVLQIIIPLLLHSQHSPLRYEIWDSLQFSPKMTRGVSFMWGF